jgi:hypothetical protein
LTLDVCALLDVFNAGDFLTLYDFVAFFYIEMRDAPESGSSEVDVGFRLDLPRPADRRDQVFPDRFAGNHLGVPGLSADYRKANNGGQGKDDNNGNDNFLQAHFPMGGFANITSGGTTQNEDEWFPDLV